MKPHTLILAAAVAFTQAAPCQTAPGQPALEKGKRASLPSKPELLTKFFDQAIDRGLFRGAVTVVEAGEVIFERAHGDAMRGARSVTLDSAFYLASISKQFTASAIMLLAQDGRLSYGDLLSTHFDELPSWSDSITIRHLLTHTSGLGDYLQADLNLDGLTNAQVVAHVVASGKPPFPPGDRYRYSNTAYVLLARIVERVSGQSFRAFTKERIFRPLGMASAVFYDETRPAISDRVFGYDRYGKLSESPMLTNGAGGMYASARDLVRWHRAIFARSLLTRETLNTAFSSTPLNDGSRSPYGFGWHVHDREGGKAVHHTGGMAGFRHFVFVDLAKKNVVIMLTNGGDSFPLPAIASAVTDILRNRRAVVPKPALCDHLFALTQRDPDGLRAEARRVARDEQDRFRCSEDDLNALGYTFLAAKRFVEAQGVFEVVLDRYPASSNAYDSYAEGLLRAGAHAALQNYRRSLEKDPGNDNAVQMIARIERLLAEDLPR